MAFCMAHKNCPLTPLTQFNLDTHPLTLGETFDHLNNNKSNWPHKSNNTQQVDALIELFGTEWHCNALYYIMYMMLQIKNKTKRDFTNRD